MVQPGRYVTMVVPGLATHTQHYRLEALLDDVAENEAVLMALTMKMVEHGGIKPSTWLPSASRRGAPLQRQDWSGQFGKGRHSPIGFSHCNIAEQS